MGLSVVVMAPPFLGLIRGVRGSAESNDVLDERGIQDNSTNFSLHQLDGEDLMESRSAGERPLRRGMRFISPA